MTKPTKKPVTIQAEPAEIISAPAEASDEAPGDHVLALAVGTKGKHEGLFYGRCSCGGFEASHHPDRGRLEELHAEHVERRRAAEAEAERRRAAKRERLKQERIARAVARAESEEV